VKHGAPLIGCGNHPVNRPEEPTMTTNLPAPLCAAILEQSADAIIYANREGYIQLWNAAAERIFGFKTEEVLGQSLDVMIPEHLRVPHWAGYRTAMDLGKTKHSGKPMLTKALHQSGGTVYVEMSFAVITDPELGTLGSVAIAREPRETKVPNK
jgi:PAS domain S-box-containing protein